MVATTSTRDQTWVSNNSPLQFFLWMSLVFDSVLITSQVTTFAISTLSERTTLLSHVLICLPHYNCWLGFSLLHFRFQILLAFPLAIPLDSNAANTMYWTHAIAVNFSASVTHNAAIDIILDQLIALVHWKKYFQRTFFLCRADNQLQIWKG